jgi:LPXTG-motif cell wall-anchored protein
VTEPPVTEPPLTDLDDPDVPLAENPKTGDPTILLAGLVVVSGSGMLWLKRKKKEEEE